MSLRDSRRSGKHDSWTKLALGRYHPYSWSEMEFQNIFHRALTIRRLYEEQEKHLYGSSWTSEAIALGFVGDVGDLAKLVIAENGKRTIPNSKEKMEHELADCLWSVIVLAKLHDIDLEQSFIDTMNKLENHLLETVD